MYTITSIKTVQRPWGLECAYTAMADGLSDINRVVPMVGDNALAVAEVDLALELSRPTEEPVHEERPSILTWIEGEKESLKWQTIGHMRENPEADPVEYLQNLPWKQQNIVGVMVYQYAVNAAAAGMCQLPDESLETCWVVLSGIANTLTIEQLQELL